MMKFEELYTSPNYYMVGVDKETGDGVIAVMITSVAWSELFFRLTAAEPFEAKSDVHALDDLAERLAIDQGRKFYADRLIS